MGNPIAWVLTLGLSCSCQTKPSPPTSTASGTHGPPTETLASSKAYVITGDKVGAFLRYRARTQSFGDGGLTASVGQQALAEERARTEAGLSVRDVEELESMIPRVIGKRVLSRQLADGQTLDGLESVKTKLPLHHQKELEALVARSKAQRTEAENLAEERQRFGNQNVDAILAREAELVQLWESEISQLAP